MGIIRNDEIKRGVLSVKRRSDRIIWVKVALNGEIINIMSAYAPQAGCGENENIKCWEEMDEELRDIPDTEKVWVGGDFNGDCGWNNSGKEETIGKYGVGESNEAGDNSVAFAMSNNMRVVNTYLEKAERHKITYKSGAAESQIGYILCRSSDKGNVKDCKVNLGESVTSQHRPLVCTLISNKATERKPSRVSRTKWWKLAEPNLRDQFTEESKQMIQQRISEGTHDWETGTVDLKQLGEELLGKTSVNMKQGKETWWWNDDVQESIQTKKLAKRTLDKDNSEENKAAYKTAKKEAKRNVAIAKARAYDHLYAYMDTTEGQSKVLRMAKERENNSKDIYQSKVIKDEEKTVLVEDLKILERWREYYQKVMNEHNPREGRNEQQAEVEGDITEINSADIEMALRNMKNGNATGPDNLPVEVWEELE